MRPVIGKTAWAVAQAIDPTQRQSVYDDEIAAALGVSQRTIRNVFATLVEIGAIESTPLRKGPRGSRPTRIITPDATCWLWAAVEVAA